MRTDVKVIAVVVAVVVVVGVVWYAVYYRSSTKKEPGRPTEQARTAGTEGTNVAERRTPGPRTPVEPGYRVPPGTTTGPGVDLGGLDVQRPVPPYIPASAQTLPPGVATYRVQPGDTYETIAERQYGTRTLAYLLKEANPNIPPERLAPGLTIKVPPEPARPVLTATRPSPTPVVGAVQPGSIGTDPVTGKRYYVVKSGDNGFWGVAQVVYGDGKYLKLIEDANPGVQATRLRPGQKLWAPERPATADTTAMRTTPAPTTRRVVGPAPAVSLRTGAPVRETLPDGRTFD